MHETFPDKLAFTDLETTGPWPPEGEIIEIGAVIADTKSLNVIDQMNVKVKPSHIRSATPESIRVTGYREADWQDALPLNQALNLYMKQAKDAVFCTWRVAFDFAFMQSALHDTGLLPGHHIATHLCVYSMALFALQKENVGPFRLKNVAAYLGIQPEPEPHRAINGAEQALEVYRKLRSMQ